VRGGLATTASAKPEDVRQRNSTTTHVRISSDDVREVRIAIVLVFEGAAATQQQYDQVRQASVDTQNRQLIDTSKPAVN